MEARRMAHFHYPSDYKFSIKFQDHKDLAIEGKSNGLQLFRTHISPLAEKLHQLNEFILLPAYKCAQLFGLLYEPNPGANKGSFLRSLVIRLMAFIGFILISPVAAPSLVLGFFLRLAAHSYRPVISFLINRNINVHKKPALTEEKPLHIRTFNLGFVPTTISTMGDLRNPSERAKEIVARIKKDPHAPSVIIFQEGFHEDATRILCDGLQQTKYSTIVHNIAPHLLGLSSGSMIASEYPLLSVDFEIFKHMQGPERLSPRGITRFRLATEKGDLLIYSIHALALDGQERAQARLKQLKRLHELMQEDLSAEPNIHQVVAGDFNVARINSWGEDNFEPRGQAEDPVLCFLADSFEDPFLHDHDPITGVRTKNAPRYLESDRVTLESKTINEPSATWYNGPFAKRTFLVSNFTRLDREIHRKPPPIQRADISYSENPSWGTPHWHRDQMATTSRFDYILFLKNSSLKAEVEIRNLGGNESSASSDHLPVDARIWVRPQ